MASRPPAHAATSKPGALGEPGHDVENALLVVDDHQQRPLACHAPPTLVEITAASADAQRPQLERRHQHGARLLVTELLDLASSVRHRHEDDRHAGDASGVCAARHASRLAARMPRSTNAAAKPPRRYAVERLVGAIGRA